MKRLLVIPLLAALVAIVSCSTKSFTIDGEIDGLSGKIYLALLQGKTPQIIDSADVSADGKFVFNGAVERPMMAQLQNANGQSLAMFMIENSEIKIDGNINEIDGIDVEGSKENNLYRSMNSQLAKAQNPEEYRAVIKDFVNANLTSYAAAYALFRELSPYLDQVEMRSMASKLDTSVQSSIYIKKLLERAATLEATSVGRPFVDFTAPNLAGEPIALSSVVGKGKWVLVDFWASWCGPCRLENPHVVKAYNMFKDKDFTVFGYSLDRKYDAWKHGVQKDSLGDWTNVSDLAFWESAPAMTYGVGSLPSNVLINPQGIIVKRNLKGDELIEYLGSNLQK